MEDTRVLVAIVLLALVMLAIVTCFQKGKQVFGVLGIVGLLIPPLVWFAIVGSVRLAKPSSPWAVRRYHGDKMERSRERFPDDVVRALPDEMWWQEDTS